MYENGYGVPVDYQETGRWYLLAATQGNFGSQFNLNVMYESGECVPQDVEQAVKWYQEAAEQSHL